jgi:hypothetical protein
VKNITPKVHPVMAKFNDPELIVELQRREAIIRDEQAKLHEDVAIANVIVYHGETKTLGRLVGPGMTVI